MNDPRIFCYRGRPLCRTEKDGAIIVEPEVTSRELAEALIESIEETGRINERLLQTLRMGTLLSGRSKE